MGNWKIVDFKKIGDSEIGYLTPLEKNKEIPFEIKRVFYIYDVPNAIERGRHAHKKLEQMLICINGSINIKIDDGYEQQTIKLDKPHKGLYIGPYIWGEMSDFTQDAVLMVLASEIYDEEDYIRQYNEFIKMRSQNLA